MSILTPRAIVSTSEIVDTAAHSVIEQIHIIDKPLVAEVSERVLADKFTAALIRYHGYRMVERYLDRRAQLMARPLPLWAILRARVLVRDAFWRGMRWAYDHGLFHLASPEGMLFRWRDVRMGRGRR